MNLFQLLFGKKTKYLLSYEHSHFITISDGDYCEVFSLKIQTVTKSVWGLIEREKTIRMRIGNNEYIYEYQKHWDKLIKNKTPI